MWPKYFWSSIYWSRHSVLASSIFAKKHPISMILPTNKYFIIDTQWHKPLALPYFLLHLYHLAVITIIDPINVNTLHNFGFIGAVRLLSNSRYNYNVLNPTSKVELISWEMKIYVVYFKWSRHLKLWENL